MGKKTDPFRVLLLSISQDLTVANLVGMKFACDGVIPDGVLEKISQPLELFTELEHLNLLTETEKDFLAELLLHVGRQELARKLLGMNVMAPKLKRTCSLLHGSLPSKVPHFLGRAMICEEVIAALNKGRIHLVTITGPPGYGKSAVAISAGHEMEEELNYHVYYVSTRGASSVANIAFQLLYSLGVVAGDDPVAQMHRYLESSHEETLLIFDNVEDMLQPHIKAKFLNFIKLIGEMAPHVKMIITSRVALAFFSFAMKNVLLPSLNSSQSAQLIRIFSPQEISNLHAETLGGLCNGVPLLVRAVAALLEKNVDPEVLINEFERSPGSTLRSLSFDGMPPEFDMYPCLELCFQRLSSDLQRYLVALSVFPSSFNIHDASCVLRDLTDIQRSVIISKLVDNSLVRPDTEGRSFYAVHSIVQIFCREVLKENDELKELYKKASNHFNMYFLSVLQDMNKKFYCTKDELRNALVSFECKKNNIFRALDNAIHEKKLLKYAADLLNSSYRFFTVRLSSEEYRRLYRGLAELFEKSDDKKRFGNCLVSLGFHQFWVMCTCRKPCPTATKLFEQARDILSGLGLTETEQYAECLSKLARAYAYDQELAKSVALVDEAKNIVERIGANTVCAMSVINDYAAVYSYHDDHKTAIKLRNDFLPVAKKQLTDHPSLGTLYDELGSSYEALGEMKSSVDCRKEAIRIFDGFLGDHKFTASSYLGLGTTLKSEGKYEEALSALRRALEIQRKTIGPHMETIITSEEIEKVLRVLGRDKEAKECSNLSRKLREDVQKKMEKMTEALHV